MPILLFSVGGFAFIAGLVLAGFGLPDSEFSFGNTLIIAGTTSAVGGLIVIGLGAVVSRLGQIIEALKAPTPTPARPSRISESSQSTSRAALGRTSFPSAAKFGPNFNSSQIPESQPTVSAASSVPPLEGQVAHSLTPTLPNPDRLQGTGDEEVPTLHSKQSARQAMSAFGQQGHASFDVNPLAESNSATRTSEGVETEFVPAIEEAYESDKVESDTVAPQWADKPRDVPILKSGVVDGMGYTLYVDGSIEAELPDGTLRFASIDELRSHLEAAS